MTPIVIIADDLTGAADTGVQFCPFYDDTILLSYLQLSKTVTPTPGSALALYTKSRALESTAAQKRLLSVARRLAGFKPIQIYKKMDSCLRGNLGVEIEALMDELAYDASFIAPAFPEMGRATVDGKHLVHGIPVGQTEISRDPVTPVTESDLCRLIQSQSRYPVEHIPLNLLEEEGAALVDEIEQQIRRGSRHVVFDATRREHLNRIARLIQSCSHRILPVGSAGLAAGLSSFLSPRSIPKSKGRHDSEGGNHLLVCGTKSEVTRRQIDTLMAMYPYEEITLDPGMLIDEKKRDALVNCAALVRSDLSVNHIIVTIDYSRPLVGSGRSLSQKQATQLLLEGLERFLTQVLMETRPDLLFLTGGDTADVALTVCGANGIRIFGEIVTGVVQSTIIGGALDGVPVVTKAGAFGGEDTLVVLHEALKEKV